MITATQMTLAVANFAKKKSFKVRKHEQNAVYTQIYARRNLSHKKRQDIFLEIFLTVQMDTFGCARLQIFRVTSNQMLVCLFVCLLVNNITQQIMNGFE